MAQIISVRLSRDGGNPWGFRLQGGKDFGTPLVIQKVNGGSPAERAGLIAGDSVIKVNATDVFNLRHKDAQDVIVRAGQTFELTVQRGGSTWKPTVTPVGSLPRSAPVSNNIAPVTKTSLAAQKQDYTPIGAAHNLSPKGFAQSPAPHVNGDGPKMVNKQYNTPIGLYSEQSIAETLSAQSEVLSTGALGVNFKKNEKNYDAEKSEVYKMLQEAEREPRTPEPVRHDVYSTMSHAIGGRATTPRPITPVPPKPQVRHDAVRPTTVVNETQGNPKCSDCERLIVGVFVRIKDKNLHVECFKCATCGSSLKNVGYYNINNKLYCDIHAKLAARSNPPAPNLVPVTVPPGGKVPAGTISAALSSHSMPSHSLPSPSALSPSGNQVAAPFSPHSKDSLERYSPNNNQNLQKVDAVANLMSVLTMATQKEFKENGTNTDPLYYAEKVIPINNSFNNNDNGDKEEQYPSPPPPIKFMPFRAKHGGSFGGPKPFSSVAPATPSHAPYSSMQPSIPGTAPISAPLSNTLPRSSSAATMPERKEWPPSKPDELPTASPLYIDPSSRNPTPQPSFEPKTPNPLTRPSQIPIVQNPATQNSMYQNPQTFIPHPPTSISQNPQISHSQVPIFQNPHPLMTIPQNPQPQMTYFQNPHPQMPIYQNPIPQITISQNPPPTTAINETKISKSQLEDYTSEYKATQEVSNISHNMNRNMSICSAEVTNITGRRSVVECVETVTDAIDTQILVNNVTKIKERPKSPPPLHRKDSVYDTQDISIVVSTQTPGGKNPSSENLMLTVNEKSNVNIEGITHSTCNPGNPQVCSNNPGHNPGPNLCPMSNPDCAVKIMTCPKNNPTCPANVQQSTTNAQSTTNVQGTSKISQETTNKIITNPVPQGYISPMVKALTIASDKPFNTVCVEIKSKEYGKPQTDKEIFQTSSMQTRQEVKSLQESRSMQVSRTAQETRAIQEAKAMQESRSVQETRALQEAKTVQESRAMQEAREVQESRAISEANAMQESRAMHEAATRQQGTVSHGVKAESKYETKFPHMRAPVAASPLASALTVAPSKPFTPIPPMSQISLEPVSLPPETAPYFPPEHPFIVEPKVQKPADTNKSPFVQALTTAPVRPYTPLTGMGQEQSDTPDFMREVPPPPKQKVSMLSALTTATERPFTPALSVGSIEDGIRLPPVEPPKPQQKMVPPPPPMPITVKPASHTSPSAFRPIGNSSFKPVAQSYKPQAPEIQRVGTSFPPVTDQLKSSYASSASYGYTSPSKIASQQGYRTQTFGQQQMQQTNIAQQQDYRTHTIGQLQMQQQQTNITQQQSYRPQTNGQQQMQQMNIAQQQQLHQANITEQQQLHQSNIAEQQQLHQSNMTQQHQMSQYSGQVQRQDDIQQARRQSLKSVSTGLQTPSSIPGYQKNISQKASGQEQMFVPQIQAPIQPIQKPVTTLQPGQYQPNNHLQTFQPVMDENQRHYMSSSSPIPRAISPSMINKPAPSIPHYQADLIAHECSAVETNLYDPRSPGISRTPSPCPGARSTSPFPRTMTKSPAQGPPPNPFPDRFPKQPPRRDERYLEAKQNLSTYIPKNQGRVEQVKNQLTVNQGGQSRQFSGQSQISSGFSKVEAGQSQFLGGQAQVATQSESFQNVQLAHNQRQQQNELYKMSEVENFCHTEQLNKSQMQSVESSADNRIQIQRTKRCTEEYERTQKERTIEIQRPGTGQQQFQRQNVSSVGGASSTGFQRQNLSSVGGASSTGFQRQNVSSVGGASSTGFQRQNVSSVGGASSIGFQRQTSVPHPQTNYSRAPQKPFSNPSNSRSNSLPGPSAAVPKQFKPSPLAATSPKAPVGSQSASRPNVPQPYAGGAGASSGRQAAAIGVAPRRGRGILNLASAPGSRVAMCGHCNMHIRGPFITALGKIWCPEHFICTTPTCRRPLQDMGFVEEKGSLYCEFCFEQYLAPFCAKCNSKIKGDCLNAIGKHFHPECFCCAYCSKLFGNSPFFLEDGLPYCEADWNELFTTKCFACGFPVEAGDRWVEALNNNYHSQCFNCTMCKKNLEGQSFYAKGGRPFCKNHAR